MKINEESKFIIIYLILGGLWIYFSDELLKSLFYQEDIIMRLQTYKGLFYVLITGLIFYLLLKKYFDRLRETKDELKIKNEELNRYTNKLENGHQNLKESYQNLYEQTEDLKIMVDFINNISKETFNDSDKFLSHLLRTAYKLVPKSDYGSIYIINNNKVSYVDAIGHDLEKLKLLSIDKSVYTIHKRKPKIIKNLLSYDKNKIPKEQYEILREASKDIKQSLTFSLVVDNEMLAGISLDLDINSDEEFSESGVQTLTAFRNIAESFYTFQRYNKLQGEFQRDIILSMIKFLEIHDSYTGGHSEEVAELSKRIAINLELNKKDVQNSYWAGLVHDIGKLIVPSMVLNKKENFKEKDYELIKNHPAWAYESLSKSKRLDGIAEYVLYHHERWDGTGYPEGLKGKEIPLISRIISVADAYSAMTSIRAYRDALIKSKAIEELKDNKGKQFDPEIVDVFIDIIKKNSSKAI
ncbi:MAG: HD-GYP domain-containing protein [Halanaerobiales bacterium]|nr:HD-GYP domain-containing protein [Halanaerobiales bacterium]